MDGEENSVFAINPMGLPLKELRRLKENDSFQLCTLLDNIA